MTLHCDSCKRTIANPRSSFRMRIEICADPSPPVFTEEDLQRDTASEMKQILEAMEKMDPQEMEDEVHEAYTYILCRPCRQKIHDTLRHGK